MNRCLVLLLACCIGVLSCKTKKEVTSKKKLPARASQKRTAISCKDIENSIVWSAHDGNGGSNELVLDSNHAYYTTNTIGLQNILVNKFRNDDPFVMTFPLLVDGAIRCMEFTLVNSNTISRDKQEEMNVYSFKGEDNENAQNTVRIDYGPKKGLNAYAIIEGKSILFEPIGVSDDPVYVTYDKKHSVKQKNEIEE